MTARANPCTCGACPACGRRLYRRVWQAAHRADPAAETATWRSGGVCYTIRLTRRGVGTVRQGGATGGRVLLRFAATDVGAVLACLRAFAPTLPPAAARSPRIAALRRPVGARG